MFIYSITTAIDQSIEQEWVNHIQSHIIPQILKTGLIEDYRFIRVIPSPGVDLSYNLQLRCENRAALNQYIAFHEQEIYKEEKLKFEGKLASFQNVLEQVSEGGING